MTTNTWDGENRLIQVEHPDFSITTYAYNADGLKVEADDGIETTRFLYDGNNLLQEKDDLGTVEAEFTYIPMPCAHLVSQQRESASIFHHFDGVRDTRQLTDAAGVITDEYKYDAWGDLKSSTGSTPNSHTFKGQLLAYRNDPHAGPEASIYSLHHRDLVASQGRFRSEDPAREDRTNPYRYVHNDPVNRSDPSGLQDLRSIKEKKKELLDVVRRLQTDPSYLDEPATQLAQATAGQDIAIGSSINTVTGAQTTTYLSGKIVYIPPPRTRVTYDFPVEPFIDFGEHIVTGPYNLVTGETGRALGDRSVAITENSGDGTFDGGLNDWARFTIRGVAGELTSMNAGGEMIGGADLATEELLGPIDRGFRGFEAVVGAAGTVTGGVGFVRKAVARGAVGTRAVPRGVDYDVFRVPGPNPNNLRQRVVTTPTAGEGGVYLKPQSGRTKIGSTNDFRGRYGASAPDGIEVEIPQTRTGPPAGVDDSAYPWNSDYQRRFDEEYLDRVTPRNVRYRAPKKPQAPVSQRKWELYRHIFGYGDLPADFGY